MESRGILIIGVILTLLASLGFGQFGGVNGGLAIIGIIVIIIAFFAWIGEKGDALKEKEHQKKIGWHKDLVEHRSNKERTDDAVKILNTRLANGEITKKEYRELKKEIEPDQ